VTYRPRQSYSETEINTGKTVDGSAVYAAAFSDTGSMATGNTRSGSITSAVTRSINMKGGCTRDGGDLLPLPGHGTVNGSTFAWVAVVDFVSSLYRIRSSVGAAFTGSGNTLTDGVIIAYYLK
jgi:hypothetical protein